MTADFSKISLVAASKDDAYFVYELRNSKEGRDVSLSQEFIREEDHVKWFNKRYLQYKIILYYEEKIGYLRTDEKGFISIMLIKKYRGMGIGTHLLERTTGKAIILFENKPSLKAFTGARWKIRGYYLEKGDTV